MKYFISGSERWYFVYSKMHLQEIFTFDSKHFNIICSLHLPILSVEKEHLYVIGSSCSWVAFCACFAKCNHCYSTSKKSIQLFKQSIRSGWGGSRKFLALLMGIALRQVHHSMRAIFPKFLMLPARQESLNRQEYGMKWGGMDIWAHATGFQKEIMESLLN